MHRAGGQVERAASGHLKIVEPAGAAIVASAPNSGRAGGRAVHNTLATIKSKTGLEVGTARLDVAPVRMPKRRARDRCLRSAGRPSVERGAIRRHRL